jgi:hypothetical protein
MRRLGLWLSAGAVCSLTVGCSSSYMPAASPRLAMVMEGGTPGYARDGKVFPGGLFGGDLEEAVRGNPTAEEYAREYKTGTETGFALTLLGYVGVIGGAVTAGAEASTTSSNVPAPGLAIMAGGLALAITGLIVELQAQPHIFDAINAYNDGVTKAADAPREAPPANAQNGGSQAGTEERSP